MAEYFNGFWKDVKNQSLRIGFCAKMNAPVITEEIGRKVFILKVCQALRDMKPVKLVEGMNVD